MSSRLLSGYDESELEEYAQAIVGHVNVGVRQDQAAAGEVGGVDIAAATKAPGPAAVAEVRATSPVSDCSVDTAQDGSSPSSSDSAGSWERFFSEAGIVPRLIQLEIQAGLQVKASTAYAAALGIFDCALRLVHRATYEGPPLSPLPRVGAPAPDIGNTPNDSEDSRYLGRCQRVVACLDPHEDLPYAASFLALDSRCWNACMRDCLLIYCEVAQCLFLSSEFRAAQLCTEYALQKVTQLNARAHFFELHVQSLTQQSHFREGLQAGLSYLAELGIELVQSLDEPLREWLYAVPDLEDEATFHQHPVFASEDASDENILAAMSLLAAMAQTLLFVGSPTLHAGMTHGRDATAKRQTCESAHSVLFFCVLPLSVSLTMLTLTLNHGLTPESGLAFAIFAMSLWRNADFRMHYACGVIASRLTVRHAVPDTLSARIALCPNLHTNSATHISDVA
jgi:hypothetical protein